MGKDDKLVEQQGKLTIKTKLVVAIQTKFRIIRFKGGTYFANKKGQWEPLTVDEFARLAYEVLGVGVDKSRIKDIEHYFMTASPDYSKLARYIAIKGKVWDRKLLKFIDTISPEDCIYSVNYQPTYNGTHRQFMLDLARGDEDLANDMMQAIAPIFMQKKPDGVIWFLGSGGNGKSSLLTLVYKLFGPFLASLTLGKIEQGRNAPALNGKIANICRETEDNVTIKDTVNYKAIGTHEPYSVDRFFSQDPLEIDSDLHYIFNTNKIPNFSDKGHSTRRRTLVIPFNNVFESDVTFEDRTFTKEFIQDFLGDLLEATKLIRDNNYSYKFSESTQKAKLKYDTEANTAETYFNEILEQDIVGFVNYKHLMTAYNVWCDDNGYVALGKKTISSIGSDKGFTKKVYRDNDNKIRHAYLLDGITIEDTKDTGWGLLQKSDSAIELDESTSSADDSLSQLLALDI